MISPIPALPSAPALPAAPSEAMEMLRCYQDPNWVKDHLQETRTGLKQLQKIDLTCQEEALRLYANVLRTHSYLFPKAEENLVTITFCEGEEEVLKITIPKNHLAALSGTFRAIQEKNISLQLHKNIDKKTHQAFLDTLNGINYPIYNDNVIGLLILADEFKVADLSSRCVEYIREILNFANFFKYCQIAADSKLKNLTWACLEFAAKDKEHTITRAIKAESISPEVKTCLDLADKCRNICLSFNSGRPKVTLNSRFSGSSAVYISSPLEKLNYLCPISSLFLENNYSDLDINLFALSVPNLDWLVIKNNQLIKAIPNKWLESIRYLNCSNCGELLCIVASATTKIDCNHCLKLEIIEAPAATDFNCSDCPQLKSVTVKQGCRIIGLPQGCEVNYT